MKKLFLFILLFIPFLQAQERLTQEEIINFYLNPLDSINYDLSSTINQIISLNLTGTLTKIEQNFWIHNCWNQKWFLNAMLKFNSSLTHQYSTMLLDSLNQPENEKYNGYTCTDILLSKIKIIEVLYKLGDYSHVNEVFELIERDRFDGFSFSNGIHLLPYIFKFRPDFKEQAKQEMLNAIEFAVEEYSVFASSLILTSAFGEEEIPEMIQIFRSVKNIQAKRGLLEFYFSKYENKFDLNGLIKESLLTEPDEELRLYYVKVLLLGFAKPSDYEFVNNYYQNEPNDTIRSLIQYEINTFLPPPTDSTKMLYDLLNDLYNYIDSMSSYTWLGEITFSTELKNILTTAKTNLQNSDSLACRVQVKTFQDLVDNVYKDSLNPDPRFVTIEGWKFLYWNAQYILDRLPEPQTNPNLVVSLKNSLGIQISASSVKYYDASWKDAVDNGDGTFTVITTRPTVSIRVFYEYASQQADNVTAQNNTYTFQTVNAAVQLKNSLGDLIDAGTVQYYAGAWRSFGTTSNGVAYKELLPVNYSFRMTYEYGGIDKQQNLSTDPVVVFQTVNAVVQLKNSLGNLIDAGTAQYYAGAWRNFGTTSSGVAYKEMLPANYSFRMTHDFVSNDKQQNLSTNPVVEFSTVLCSVKVSNTNNQPLNNANVKYYASAWRDIGLTNTDGIITKELLPADLSFRASYGSVSLDKQQNILLNSLVEFILNVQ